MEETIEKTMVGTVRPDSPPPRKHHEDTKIIIPNVRINADLITNEINNVVKQSTENKRVFNASELISRQITEIPTLVEPIFPQVGLIALIGSSDAGKSRFLRQLSVSVVVGDSRFAGFHLNPRYNRAIYVSTEDDELTIAKWLNTENETRGLPNDAYSGLSYIFDTQNLLVQLEQMVSVEPVDLIVVDAFADLYGKNMNQSNEVRTFLHGYSQLADKHQCLVIMLHHAGKRTEMYSPSKHHALGSQGFESKCRVVVELRTDVMNPSMKHLCIVKANNLPGEYKNESYVLRINENVQFEFTGERVPFGELKTDNGNDMRDAVRELKSQGKTQIEISQTLGLSQPTVSRYLKT